MKYKQADMLICTVGIPPLLLQLGPAITHFCGFV